MASRSNQSDIDGLFRLPLDQFTAARNALAKETGTAAIRTLTRPPVAAWAVNQLFWRERDAYANLVTASDALRKAHRAVLAGRTGDLRAAGRAHDQALDRAVKATMAILSEAGHPATHTTHQAVVSTLRALPGDEAPGRLTHTLQPGGFEILAGLPIARGTRIAAPEAPPARAVKKESAGAAKADKAREAKALAREKEAARLAAAARQRAEHEARREEFERARAARDADKAAAAVERARDAVRQAEQELEEAERAAKTANANRERAERRAKEAEAKLAALEA